MIKVTQDMAQGLCGYSPDGQHCEHWWDEEECHFCGLEGQREGEFFSLVLGKYSVVKDVEGERAKRSNKSC